MGWLATIPLMPPGRDRDGNPVNTKRPAITGWETFNSRAPTDPEISAWARFYPAGGIGLAYGPDRVVGIDLDWQDRETAAATWDIAQRILGPTPLIKIGAPPKRLALYRAADGLRVEGKAFGGFEVFTRSGQTVLFALHPGTGRAYAWPEESPLTVGPDKLPVVTSEHITALIQCLAPYRPARALPPRSPRHAPQEPPAGPRAWPPVTGPREWPPSCCQSSAKLQTPLPRPPPSWPRRRTGNATTRWWARSSR